MRRGYAVCAQRPAHRHHRGKRHMQFFFCAQTPPLCLVLVCAAKAYFAKFAPAARNRGIYMPYRRSWRRWTRPGCYFADSARNDTLMMAFARTLLVRSSTACQRGAGREYSSQSDRLVDRCTAAAPPLCPHSVHLSPMAWGPRWGAGWPSGAKMMHGRAGRSPTGLRD